MTTLSPAAALDLTFTDPDSYDELTIREYLKRFISAVWHEGEGFSGKRPFGNSGWQHNLEQVLVENGCVAGTLDRYEEHGEEHVEVSEVESNDYFDFIHAMIDAL